MKIVIVGKDKSVAIMELAPCADKEEAIRKFKESHPKGFYGEYFEYSGELPLSREHREHWRWKNNKIVEDIPRTNNKAP